MQRLVQWWCAGMVAGLLILVSLPAVAAKDPYAEGLKMFRAGQYAKAYKQLLPLARKKDARAMYLVGVMYDGGRGVPQDDPTAAGWFESSARLGNASGQYALARMTIEGRGVAKSRQKGIELLQAAAGQGHKEATALLERLGLAVVVREAPVAPAAPVATARAAPGASSAGTPAKPPASPPAASAAAAEKPVPVVFKPLDRKVAQAAATALDSLLQRLAVADDVNARKGLPFLALDYARQYWHVEAVGDVALADEFARVARQHADALVALAGELSGSKVPESQAVGGLLVSLAGAPSTALRTGCPATILAAQGGFAFAWFQGARCIAERNATQASDWMRAAAAAGHAGAQESVGRSCLEGEPKNWPCAKEWLGRSAGNGRTSSMPVLGWALANQPQPSEADQRAALGWYEKAADGGDLFAMNNLAALLERGPAPLRNEGNARRWYAQAARTGFGPAQYNFGRMLAEGIGGTADRTEAAEWLRKAAAAGVPEAQAALELLMR